jgi:KDO2-lipid IV(A) lauroyltransferase
VTAAPGIPRPRRRRGDRWRRLRGALVFPLFRLLPGLFGRLSWSSAQRLGTRLGSFAWAVSRRDRRRALEHLAIAFPELDPGARTALARACFRHHGTSFGEAMHLVRRDCAALAAVVSVTGWEHVEAARRERRLVIIHSAHCGNWEIVAAALNCRGLGMAVVGRALQDSALDGMLLGLRSRFGTATIHRGSAAAPRQLRAVLRGGGALGVLIDQDLRDEGVWVPFFGRLAHTPVGPAQIALRQRAVVLPTFGERLEDGTHRVTVAPPLALPADPTAATAAMTAAIEAQVRRRPEQWVWMHRRWRRPPPPETEARVEAGRGAGR